MAFQPNFTLADPFGAALSGFQIGNDMAAQQQQLELQRQQAAQQQQAFDFQKSLWGNVRQQSDMDLARANLGLILDRLKTGEFGATSPFRIQNEQTQAARNSLGLAAEEISAIPQANANAAVANVTAQNAPQMGAQQLQLGAAQLQNLFSGMQSRAVGDQLAQEQQRLQFANAFGQPVGMDQAGSVSFMSGNGQVASLPLPQWLAMTQALRPQPMLPQAPGAPQASTDPFGMPQFVPAAQQQPGAPAPAAEPAVRMQNYPQVGPMADWLNMRGP